MQSENNRKITSKRMEARKSHSTQNSPIKLNWPPILFYSIQINLTSPSSNSIRFDDHKTLVCISHPILL